MNSEPNGKEFGGGAMPEGFQHVPVDWVDDEAMPVGVTQFDYDAIDTLEDRARECLAEGRPLSPLLEEVAMKILNEGPPEIVERMVRRIYTLAGEEVTARLIAMIIDARDPKFRMVAIAHEIGSTVLCGESVPQTAARFGKRKQALDNEMKRVRQMLGFELSRNNKRDAGAREKMRRTNFRHRG